MKLLKMCLLAAFVPTLALADPPENQDQNAPVTTPDQAPKPSDTTAKDQAKPMDQAPFGLTVKALTPEQRQSSGAKDAGLLVTGVQPGSPAATAGVQTGDVITKIDDAPLAETGDLDKAWQQAKSKSQASIELVRDKKTMNVTMTAAPPKSPDKMQPKSQGGPTQAVTRR
jgi:predicted metalloprotease with PDZ domain